VPDPQGIDESRVRTAEVVATLSLATDLGIGVPLEHGLHSTLIAMRLCRALELDAKTTSQTYYTCLLFYVGCTATAETATEIFGVDDALTTHGNPVRFGSQREMMTGLMRAVAPPGGAPALRALQIARGLPKLAMASQGVLAAACEAATMLTAGLGLPPDVSSLFAYESERWDGKGRPGRARREEIPLAVRIVHVARDAAFQMLLGGRKFAADVIRQRSGHAFDPTIANRLANDADQLLLLDAGTSSWDETLAFEPTPWLMLEGKAIEHALHMMGNFVDLVSPYHLGHSMGVAELATSAAEGYGFEAARVTTVRRSALVHDLGRVAVPTRIWQQSAPLTPDDWEKVRLHPYYTDRVLARSPFLAALAPIASSHHERLDGSGYHRGSASSALSREARLVAAADAYQGMREPRPHRGALSAEHAASLLTKEARAGRLDPDAVVAVIEVSGQAPPRIERVAGLTGRQVEVVCLLAGGLQTKQIARALGISTKTADRHVQNAYAKMGVSTRAGAALFVMQHGFMTWGELPMGEPGGSS
jgi:HD-GYP domain-containing protein (c-di-GMP phosphodiesterase class II)